MGGSPLHWLEVGESGVLFDDVRVDCSAIFCLSILPLCLRRGGTSGAPLSDPLALFSFVSRFYHTLFIRSTNRYLNLVYIYMKRLVLASHSSDSSSDPVLGFRMGRNLVYTPYRTETVINR